MYWKEPPQDFNPTQEAVSCFIECKGEILMLLRQDHKSYGNTWGAPAGKKEKNEEINNAIIREVKEETGLDISQKEFKWCKKMYVRYPENDFIYHIFHLILEEKPEIKIRLEEHKEAKWLTPKEWLNYPLILDEDNSIKDFYNL
jgi:8-oxo-dGTP pyrophosphatase MutT (NUDIX family)